LASEYADRVKFYRVNIDSEKELSEYFHASYIPLFIFISLNDTPEQISGSMSRETLKGHIDAILPEDK
jgi:thioredoxin-like negative regulator of GroEL